MREALHLLARDATPRDIPPGIPSNRRHRLSHHPATAPIRSACDVDRHSCSGASTVSALSVMCVTSAGAMTAASGLSRGRRGLHGSGLDVVADIRPTDCIGRSPAAPTPFSLEGRPA